MDREQARRWRLLRALAPMAICAAVTGSACAATYRCEDTKKRVTFQDFPCEQAIAPVPGQASPYGAGQPVPATQAGAIVSSAAARVDAGSYASARGAWRGQAQMHFTTSGQQDLAAHRVALLVLESRSDGKVTGFIADAGCRISGLGSQFVTPAMNSLDVTLTECVDSRFNGRYQGMLSASAADKEVRLQLNALRPQGLPIGRIEQMSVSAVMRR